MWNLLFLWMIGIDTGQRIYISTTTRQIARRMLRYQSPATSSVAAVWNQLLAYSRCNSLFGYVEGPFGVIYSLITSWWHSLFYFENHTKDLTSHLWDRVTIAAWVYFKNTLDTYNMAEMAEICRDHAAFTFALQWFFFSNLWEISLYIW